MGPFALPVPAYRQRHRKRKRQDDAAQQASASLEEGTIRSSASPFTSDSINPRSHGPHILRQLAVAGLTPEDELPSKFYPNFPHSPLPSEDIPVAGGRRRRRSHTRMSSVTTSGSEADVDKDASESQAPPRSDEDPSISASHFSARMKHLSTLTTIMHRCLHEGDIPRAKRAFHLLIRSRDVDIRLNELWSIGTEILMRDGEPAEKGQHQGVPEREDEDESEAEAEPARWGSAANVGKVTQYLDSLIHQYPFDWNRPLAIGAVDFYLALFSIEIYNIDAEFKRALWHVDREFEVEPSQDDGYNASEEDIDYEVQLQRERRWAAKDEIRQQTQRLAQDLAARMDQRMDVGPYAQCFELLRLRGMLAMFIGDLFLSSRFAERSGLEHQMKGLSLREGGFGSRSDDPDDRVAIGRRDDEFARARGFFQRIPANGGELDPWIKKFVEDDGEDEEMSSMLA